MAKSCNQKLKILYLLELLRERSQDEQRERVSMMTWTLYVITDWISAITERGQGVIT